MSRINTRILRVPGTTSGQIDERPIGSFNAPMQAAGKALASMGDLGKEIALREQRAKDVRNGNSLLNDWSAYESEMKDRLAEAVTSEEAAGFKEEIEAKHEEMIGRLGDIGSDEYSDELRAKLGISAAINEIQVDTSSRRLLVNETRFEVREAAKNALMKKVAAGDLQGGKAEVRRLFEQASGTAWSEEQIEAQIKEYTAGLGYLEAQADLAADKFQGFNSYDMTPTEIQQLKVQKISQDQQKGDSINRYRISSGNGRAVRAAGGKWDGEVVGREKAKEKLMQSIETMEFDSPIQKREYIQSISTIFETQSLRNEMLEYSAEGPTLAVSGLRAMLDLVESKTDEIGLESADELKEEIKTRIEAIESQEIKEDRDLEIERLKEERKLIEAMQTEVRGAIEDAENFLRSPEAGEDAWQQAREQVEKALSEVTGIGPGVDHNEYTHGAGTYFKVKDMTQSYLNDFLEKIPKVKNRQQVHWDLASGGPKAEAALQQLGDYYVGVSDYGPTEDEKFLEVLNPKDVLESIESIEDRTEYRDARKAYSGMVGEFAQMMHYSKEQGKLPPSIESWFNQLGPKNKLTPEEKHEIIRAGAIFASDYGVDLKTLLPNVSHADRERMIKYASLDGLEGDERFQEAMQVDTTDPGVIAANAEWLDKNKRDHIEFLLNDKSIGIPGSDEKISLLMQAFKKRGYTPEEALEEGLVGNEHFTNLFAYEGEAVLRYSTPAAIAGGAFTEDQEKLLDEAYNRAVERYFGNLAMTSYSTGGGERELVSYPVESNLPQVNGEVLTGPLVSASIRSVLQLTDAQMSKMAAAGFEIAPLMAIRQEYGDKDKRDLLNQKGDFPGQGRLEAMQGLKDMSKRIEEGKATEDDLREYMQSREFYSKINDDDWTGWSLSKLKGLPLKALMLNPTGVHLGPAVTGLAAEAIFKSDLPEDLEAYFRENFIIAATDEVAPPEDVASANAYFAEIQSGIGYGNYKMPVGSEGRYKYSLTPAVGGKGINLENPGVMWFQKEDYMTGDFVEKVMIPNLKKPEVKQMTPGQKWMTGYGTYTTFGQEE